MRTSVVVVAYRPHRWLEASIASVVEQADEVVVVDNGSPGNEVSRRAATAGARVLALPRNTGLPAAINAALRSSAADVFGLLNDDAMAAPGWLASAVSVLEDPRVAAVGPKLVFAFPHREVLFDDEAWFAPGDARPLGRQIHQASIGGVDVLPLLTGPGIHRLEQGPDGDRWRWTAGSVPFYVPIDPEWEPADLVINGEPAPVVRATDVVNSAGAYLTASGYAGDRGSGTADDGQFDAAMDVFSLCGAALAFTRATLERVGPFAGEFFAYYEDTDWCWRARLAGLEIRYDPRAVVRHVGGVTSGGLMSEATRNLSARNRLLCLTRNAPLAKAWHQVRAEVFGVPPVGLRRAPLSFRLPRALGQRARLSQGWKRSPAEVWDRWVGVGETWQVRSGR